MKIGEQLYSLRHTCKTPEDLNETLKTIHDIGYRYVQISGICECEAETLSAMLKSNDIQAPSCHVSYDQLNTDANQVLSYYNSIGCRMIGIGMMPKVFRESLDGVREFIKNIRPITELFAANGQKLYYHNHAFEFRKDPKTGLCPFDLLRNETDLSFILDTYWIQMGGHDPARLIAEMNGKSEIVHFKDWEMDGNEPHFGPILRGNLDWDRIYKACEEIGIEYAFVEQDKTFNEEDPLDCARISYQNMQKKGWVK